MWADMVEEEDGFQAPKKSSRVKVQLNAAPSVLTANAFDVLAEVRPLTPQRCVGEERITPQPPQRSPGLARQLSFGIQA